MTRHLFKLIWNRKRQNFLLIVEVFCAFLVVVALGVLGAHLVNNVRQPLGFDASDVWTVQMHRPDDFMRSTPESKAAARDLLRLVLTASRELPTVTGLATAFTGPYRTASWESVQRLPDGREIAYSSNRVDDDFDDVLQIRMVAGRWFSPEDEGVTWLPVVVNVKMARDIFGTTDVVGREIPELPPPNAPADARPEPPKRIVGVIEDFRQYGELSTPGGVLMRRLSLNGPIERVDLPEIALLHVAPGTTAAFEETLVRRLEAVAPGWSFTVTPVSVMREGLLRQFMIPLVALAIVAGFLLLMVGLGLTGVVWQTVTQRTPEFGLRRAQGATAVNVGRQVLGELLVMTSLSIAAGLLLLAQIPFLPLPQDLTVVPRDIFIGGVAVSVAAIYLVTVLSGWYPSRLATRVAPADALHYE
jgi:putative ABC transport system permease protein